MCIGWSRCISIVFFSFEYFDPYDHYAACWVTLRKHMNCACSNSCSKYFFNTTFRNGSSQVFSYYADVYRPKSTYKDYMAELFRPHLTNRVPRKAWSPRSSLTVYNSTQGDAAWRNEMGVWGNQDKKVGQ